MFDGESGDARSRTAIEIANYFDINRLLFDESVACLPHKSFRALF